MYAEHSISVIVALDEKYNFQQVQHLFTNSDASLVAVVRCTEELLALCRHVAPTVILLDMSIAKSPESTIRDLLAITNGQTTIIATSTNGKHDSAYAMSAIEFGASCFIKNIFSGQPFPIDTSPQFYGTHEHSVPISLNEIRRFISNILYDLNLSPESSGFHLLRELILNIANSGGVIPEITKDELDCIAKKFKTSIRTVERSLNSFVMEMNEKNSRKQILQAVTNKELSTDSSFVNVKEFVALVADELRLDFSRAFIA